MEMPLKWGRIDTHEAMENFNPSLIASTGNTLPSKHLEFLSFQINHRTAGKEVLHMIFPLIKEVLKCQDWKSLSTDRGKVQEQPNQPRTDKLSKWKHTQTSSNELSSIGLAWVKWIHWYAQPSTGHNKHNRMQCQVWQIQNKRFTDSKEYFKFKLF